MNNLACPKITTLNLDTNITGLYYVGQSVTIRCLENMVMANYWTNELTTTCKHGSVWDKPHYDCQCEYYGYVSHCTRR